MSSMGSTAIQVENLTWRYTPNGKAAIDRLSLVVSAGEVVGIVGANEQGKSTLLSCLCGLIPNSVSGVYEGAVSLFGRVVKGAEANELAQLAGLVFSDPETQFTSMTVEEELVFGMENLGFSEERIRTELRRAALLTGIEELIDRSPYDLSGGQKQRVAIAAVLAMRPRIMLFDEPTSMIDPRGKQEVFDILHELKSRRDHTLLIAEHDMELLAPLVDRVVLLREGGIVADSTPQEFFSLDRDWSEVGIDPPAVTLFSIGMRRAGHEMGTPLDLDSAVRGASAVLEPAPVGRGSE